MVVAIGYYHYDHQYSMIMNATGHFSIDLNQSKKHLTEHCKEISHIMKRQQRVRLKTSRNETDKNVVKVPVKCLTSANMVAWRPDLEKSKIFDIMSTQYLSTKHQIINEGIERHRILEWIQRRKC